MTRTLLRPGGASDSCPRESQVQVPARESLLDVLVREKRFGRPPAMPGAVGTGRQRRGDPDSIPGEELRLHGSSSPGVSPPLLGQRGGNDNGSAEPVLGAAGLATFRLNRIT